MFSAFVSNSAQIGPDSHSHSPIAKCCGFQHFLLNVRKHNAIDSIEEMSASNAVDRRQQHCSVFVGGKIHQMLFYQPHSPRIRFFLSWFLCQILQWFGPLKANNLLMTVMISPKSYFIHKSWARQSEAYLVSPGLWSLIIYRMFIGWIIWRHDKHR